MARLPRLTLPGHPHHVIQRGNNRQRIFLDEADFRLMLALLSSQSREAGVAVHSYVLMDNHFHLLATPESEGGLPALMQSVGRSYVRHFNDRHGRTGTLWEGRYRSTLVQAERYLLACMVYIDLNPVRAGLVQAAADYAWSSYRHYAGIASDRLVTPHALLWALGNTPFAREQAYESLIAAGLPEETHRKMTEQTLRGWALGEPGYIQELQRHGARRPAPLPAGRRRRVNLSPIEERHTTEPQKTESDPH
ncbi:MAG TPA: transposase [Ramlibacter sp.]|nr:transposase [Ramlibacter sp.]